MSSGKAHIVWGFVFSLIAVAIVYYSKRFDFALLSDWKLLIFILPVIILYSLAPDLDMHNSTISKWLLSLSAIMITLGFIATKWNYLDSYKNFLILGILALDIGLIVMNFNHRGFAHSLIFGLLITAPLIFISWIVFGFGLIAFIGHLLVDGEGIKIW